MESLKNIFAVADLRKRVLFTLGLLAVYRVGGHIPTPGINKDALAALVDQAKGTMFGLYDMFSGKNLSQMTIFALGIMPYISSSIILQLLTVVWPYLERLSKEGELGRRKITQYTRYGTILLSVVQSLGIAYFLEKNTGIAGGLPLVYSPGWGFRLADGAHADDRHDVHHVARRADHRARHRQRHVAHHLRGHRRQPAARRHHDDGAAADRADGAGPAVAADRADGCRSSRRSCSSSADTGGSRSSTRSAWSAGGCTAARARTFR